MNKGGTMLKLLPRAFPGSLAATALLVALALTGCGPQPTYQVVQSPPPARVGTVESVREAVEQRDPSGAGLIVGGLVGGGLGSLVGSGTGRTLATVVGALGGGYIGHEVEKSKTQVVYQIGIKYDDGSWATIRQTAPTGLRIGDRVRVTDYGVELLR
jgi:outer membrane lipoprotein SlyB